MQSSRYRQPRRFIFAVEREAQCLLHFHSAAGTTGREILFQATSEEMIEAYSHVPR